MTTQTTEKIKTRRVGNQAPMMYMYQAYNKYGLVSEIEIKEGDILAIDYNASGWKMIKAKKILNKENVTGRYKSFKSVVQGKLKSVPNFTGEAHYYMLEVEQFYLQETQVEILEEPIEV